MSDNRFSLETEEEVDELLKDYSDEHLIEYIGLNKDFTQTDLAEKIQIYKNNFKNSNRPNKLVLLYYFDEIKERLDNYLIENQEEEEEEEQVSYKIKTKKKIPKRHTLIINSDKRSDRTQGTTSFSWELADEIANVKSLSIESYNIPKTWSNISHAIGNDMFGISYSAPIKLYFTGNPATLVSKFNAKTPRWTIYDNHNNEGYIKNWFNENIVTNDIGAGVIRDHTGRTLKEFPDIWVDLSWNVTIDGTTRFDVSTNKQDVYLDISYIESVTFQMFQILNYSIFTLSNRNGAPPNSNLVPS